MEFGKKMFHADKKKRRKTNNGRNITRKSSSNQNARRNGKVQAIGNFESGRHQTSRDEINNKKCISDEIENFWKPCFAAGISSKR